jgi:isocitrate dehydrogenase
LGEFLALAASFEHLGSSTNNPTASLLGNSLDEATSRLLDEGKSPSRKVNELDNRGSHFYIALWWAEAMANQSEDSELAALFEPLATALANAEETVVQDLIDCQGVPMDIGGYYFPDTARASQAMRPSSTFNSIIDQFSS